MSGAGGAARQRDRRAARRKNAGATPRIFADAGRSPACRMLVVGLAGEVDEWLESRLLPAAATTRKERGGVDRIAQAGQSMAVVDELDARRSTRWCAAAALRPPELPGVRRRQVIDSGVWGSVRSVRFPKWSNTKCGDGHAFVSLLHCCLS